MLNNILDRIKLPFRKEKELYLSLYNILGFYPHNIEHYKMALLHKSIAKRTSKGKPINNERLEFLGDAVLGCVVGDIVYQHFPGKREGFLTNARSKIVQRETLNKLAREIGLDKLLLSNTFNSSHNSYIDGNAFEALIGAIYLDRGYDTCMKFIEKRILNKIINIDKIAYKLVNFKSRLIEWCQKNKVVIEYRLLKQGKDANGNPFFNYQVFIEDIEGCSATGFTKKESQQRASQLTLALLRQKPQLIDEILSIKSERTKMEENLLMALPSAEDQDELFNKIEAKKEETPAEKSQEHDDSVVMESIQNKLKKNGSFKYFKPYYEEEGDSTEKEMAQKTKESIIQAAEDAAFTESEESEKN